MNREQFLQDILYPVVRVRAKNAGGSGTVVWSQQVGKEAETYILTNHHVISGLIKVEKKYDSFIRRDTPQETRGTATIDFFDYPTGSILEGSFSMPADIVAYNESHDLALLQIRSSQQRDYVAKMPPPSRESELYLADRVFAVGAALGHAPMITEGRINFMNEELEEKTFWISDAPIIFGNSGGAVFSEDKNEFIGVPSRIALTQIGWSFAPVTHIGMFIPFTRVYEWLYEEYYHFIFDPSVNAEECHQERQLVQDEMSRMSDILAAKEHKENKVRGSFRVF